MMGVQKELSWERRCLSRALKKELDEGKHEGVHIHSAFTEMSRAQGMGA